MDVKYNLKVTPAAENDLDGIYLHISETLKAPVAAQNLMDKLERRFFLYVTHLIMSLIFKDKNRNACDCRRFRTFMVCRQSCNIP
ncbi:MAG: type II toxin-antitoxin system RelE/ParE family toxin [Oscillospiraceae bacterium]|nr:type II toxin-antitoxin system RelE/ParE family toxin [Oscillospiraceae bacterium]